LTLAIAGLAYRVPQSDLQQLFEALRAEFPDAHLTLVLDGPTEDLHLLAGAVDLISYSPGRRGFGVARSSALAAGRLAGADWNIVFDADGQHRAPALRRLFERVLREEWQAAIPQRTLVDLEFGDAAEVKPGGALNRIVAERFDGFCLATAADRPDLIFMDFQPGVFVLSGAAREVLEAHMRSRQYSWDIEASYRLLRSGLTLGFPEVESFSASGTSFTLADSRRNIQFIEELVGAHRMRALIDGFARSTELIEKFGAGPLEAQARHALDSLNGL